MPIRMLRDWTDSEKVNVLTVHAERFFTRLIMKVDDYGCFYASPPLLKASCFPLLLDAIREADISRWMAECQKAGLIVLYEAGGKRYLQILDFRQRLDKARAKFPLPDPELLKSTENQSRGEFPEVVNEFPAETETETETERKPKRGRLVLASEDATSPGKAEYDLLAETLMGKSHEDIWMGIKGFIEQQKPKFIEPYMDIWNIFAMRLDLIKLPQKVTVNRRKKFKTRIAEPDFDFLRILEKIKKSDFLRGKVRDWKVSIEFILENEENYTKILEGKYDNN